MKKNIENDSFAISNGRRQMRLQLGKSAVYCPRVNYRQHGLSLETVPQLLHYIYTYDFELLTRSMELT